MPAETRGTLVKDSCRGTLALILMLAAGVGLSACNAEAVGGPSKFSEPGGEVGDVGGGIDEIGAPHRPCLLLRADPCR